MKNWKMIVSMILALALMLSLSGCRAGSPAQTPSSGAPTDDTARETELVADPVPDITLDPGEVDETIAIDDVYATIPIGEVPGENDTYAEDLLTLRVQDISQTAFESLIAKYQSEQATDVPVIHLRDTGALNELLTSVGSAALSDACASYGQNFFADYDLLIIPRITNTGSARHTAQVYQDASGVVVQLSVEVPEISTADMAQWCLMLAVPKVSEQGTVTAVVMGMGSGIVLPSPEVNK